MFSVHMVNNETKRFLETLISVLRYGKKCVVNMVIYFLSAMDSVEEQLFSNSLQEVTFYRDKVTSCQNIGKRFVLGKSQTAPTRHVSMLLLKKEAELETTRVKVLLCILESLIITVYKTSLGTSNTTMLKKNNLNVKQLTIVASRVSP